MSSVNAIPFKLASVRRDRDALPMLIAAAGWVDLRVAADAAFGGSHAALGVGDMIGDWDRWADWLATVAAVPPQQALVAASDGAALDAPFVPRQIYGAVANFYDHAAEMGDPRPDPARQRPFHFLKPLTSVTGPFGQIALPTAVARCDWEAELVAVIGRPAVDVSAEDALACVAGYCVTLDVTARDGRRRDVPFDFDWVRMKGWPTFGPLGPWIVPAQFVPDPQDLGVKLWIDGELLQDFSTAGMVFGLAEQIEWLSSMGGLLPGDAIATGTGAGVGMARGRFLEPGQVVTVEVAGVGRIEHAVVEAGR